MRKIYSVCLTFFLSFFIILLIADPVSAQDDPAKNIPPGEKAQIQQAEVQQDGANLNKEEPSKTKDQVQDKEKKKKEEQAKKDVREVKSNSPDMKKAKGARPPYISRPSGAGKPAGAGKPTGAVKPGRR